VLVKLAGTEDIQAAVILHPGPTTEDEIKGKATPVNMDLLFSFQPQRCNFLMRVLDLVLGTGAFIA